MDSIFQFTRYTYDKEYLPSIMDGKIDEEFC